MSRCICCDGGYRKDVRVSFCPKCKSRSVGYVFRLGNLFGVVPKMRCRSCGFSSVTFPVLVANEAELKKAVGEMKKKVAKNTATHKSVSSKVDTGVLFSSGKRKKIKKKTAGTKKGAKKK